MILRHCLPLPSSLSLTCLKWWRTAAAKKNECINSVSFLICLKAQKSFQNLCDIFFFCGCECVCMCEKNFEGSENNATAAAASSRRRIRRNGYHMLTVFLDTVAEKFVWIVTVLSCGLPLSLSRQMKLIHMEKANFSFLSKYLFHVDEQHILRIKS